MDISFTMLNKTETLIVDAVEHEFLSDSEDSMRMAIFLTCGLILGTNVPLIVFILSQSSKTFLDNLIVFDCFLCMNGILLLLKKVLKSTFESSYFWSSICVCHVFFSFFTNLCNRLLTVGIALYRFTLVFGSSFVSTNYQRKILEKTILLVILLVPVYLTGWAVYYRENYRNFLGIN